MSNINDYIRSMRGDRYTQQEMANNLKISLRQYQRYEKDADIPIATIKEIGQILNVSALRDFEKIMTSNVAIEELEKELQHLKDMKAAGDSSLKKAEKQVDQKNFSMEDVIERLDRIEVNLIETRHGVELNQALAKANLFQNAKLESVLTKKSHQSILEGLNKVTAKIFDEMHELTNQTNEVHS